MVLAYCITISIWSTYFVVGGPYRDSMDSICRGCLVFCHYYHNYISELMSPVLPLFVVCPNGKADNGFNYYTYF